MRLASSPRRCRPAAWRFGTCSRCASTTRSPCATGCATSKSTGTGCVALRAPAAPRLRLYTAGSAEFFERGKTTVDQALAVRPHQDGASEMLADPRGLSVSRSPARKLGLQLSSRRAPSTMAESLAQAMLGATWARPTKVPKPQSVPAITRSGPSSRDEALQALRHQHRVLDEVARRVHHARDHVLALGHGARPRRPATRDRAEGCWPRRSGRRGSARRITSMMSASGTSRSCGPS